jgi:hypothetical protein
MVPIGAERSNDDGAPDQGQVGRLADLSKIELVGGRGRTTARFFVNDCTRCARGGAVRWVAFEHVAFRGDSASGRYRIRADNEGVTLRSGGGRAVRRAWRDGPPPTP